MPFVALGQSLPEGFSRDRVAVATRVRSTIIMSSRLMVREFGFFERYEKQLSPADRLTLDALVVEWVPVLLLRAHYSALDRLALPVETQLALGRGLSNRIAHCKNAWRGIVLGATEMFSTRAYVHEVPALGGPNRLSYRVSWA